MMLSLSQSQTNLIGGRKKSGQSTKRVKMLRANTHMSLDGIHDEVIQNLYGSENILAWKQAVKFKPIEKQLELAARIALDVEKSENIQLNNSPYERTELLERSVKDLKKKLSSSDQKPKEEIIEEETKDFTSIEDLVEDEVVDDIDFDQACRGVFAKALRDDFNRKFPRGLKLPKGNKPGTSADVLYENFILTLTNLLYSLNNGHVTDNEISPFQFRSNLIELIEDLNKNTNAHVESSIANFFGKAIPNTQRGTLRLIMHSVLQDLEVTKAIESITTSERRKEVEGELEIQKFIYLSGLCEEQAKRKTTATQIIAMMEVSEGMIKQAQKLLNEIKSKLDVRSYCQMGPPKNRLGTFKKATRKIMGREKDTPWETLNYVNWPVKKERLCVSIKDIIRGTLIFRTYQDMIQAYHDIAGRVKGDNYSVKLLGITKATTGFVEAENATHRDMKMVVILKMNDASNQVIDDADIEYFPGVAFEIQFNTIRGALIKSGTVEKKEHQSMDASNDPQKLLEVSKVLAELGYEQDKDKQDKDKPRSTYLNDTGDFNAMTFLKDCLKCADEDIKSQVEGLISKNKNVTTIKKAHAVYKMKAGPDKKKLEGIYQDIYKCGYMVDGFKGNNDGTSKKIKKYVNSNLSKEPRH